MNFTGIDLREVNIGSSNGLMPDGTNPLPEPMLTQFNITIWHMNFIRIDWREVNIGSSMAWCLTASSHYLSQCWPSSISQYGFTELSFQWLLVSHVMLDGQIRTRQSHYVHLFTLHHSYFWKSGYSCDSNTGRSTEHHYIQDNEDSWWYHREFWPVAFSFQILILHIPTAMCQTAVSPLVIQRRYCRLASWAINQKYHNNHMSYSILGISMGLCTYSAI